MRLSYCPWCLHRNDNHIQYRYQPCSSDWVAEMHYAPLRIRPRYPPRYHSESWAGSQVIEITEYPPPRILCDFVLDAFWNEACWLR